MTLSRGEYGWVEAGTVLHFEPQPNKSYIPRLGQYFPSYEVVKMEAYIALRERVQELEQQWHEATTHDADLERTAKPDCAAGTDTSYTGQIKTLTRQLATLTTAHQQAVEALAGVNKDLESQRLSTYQAVEREHAAKRQLQAVEAALKDMKEEVNACVEELIDEVLQPMNEGDMNPVKMNVCLAQLTQAVEAIYSKVMLGGGGT